MCERERNLKIINAKTYICLHATALGYKSPTYFLSKVKKKIIKIHQCVVVHYYYKRHAVRE